MSHSPYLIVGAGPAGCQMAYCLQSAGIDYEVLEAADGPASFFRSHPRHRQLLSLNKRNNYFPEREFNMRHDWNSLLSEEHEPLFGAFSKELYPNADDLCRYMEAFVERHSLNIRFGCRVTSIARDADGFRVTTADGTLRTCDRVLMATGATRPWLPDDIPGIEHVPNYEDHHLDRERYENRSVLIVGRGNSAFEIANGLASSAAVIHVAIGNRPIDLAWNTHSVGDVRAVNNTIVEMLHVKALHGVLGLNVRSIREAENGGYDVIADEEVPHWETPGMLQLELHYDEVICCTGYQYTAPELFDQAIQPTVCSKSKFPILDSAWQSSTEGLYYIGTAMAARDKKAASSFIHGFRYNIRTLSWLLQERFHDTPYPSTTGPLQSEADLLGLADHILQRLSVTAALYQMYGFLCDVFERVDGVWHHYPELPRDYVMEHWTEGRELVLMTYEYGFDRYPDGVDTLSFITQADEVSSRRCAAYLHPVFRHISSGTCVMEDNLGESLMLRYGPHRALRLDHEPTTPESAEDVERNTVANILNRVWSLTDTEFDETASLGGHVFKAWPADRPRDLRGLPVCTQRPVSPSDEPRGHGA